MAGAEARAVADFGAAAGAAAGASAAGAVLVSFATYSIESAPRNIGAMHERVLNHSFLVSADSSLLASMVASSYG